MGDYARAEPLYVQALATVRHSLDQTAEVQSERQQLVMTSANRHILDNWIALIAANGLNEAAYVEVLNWKCHWADGSSLLSMKMVAASRCPVERLMRHKQPELQSMIPAAQGNPRWPVAPIRCAGLHQK